LCAIARGNCVDMLTDREQHDRIAGGDEVWRLTRGWLRYWKAIFRHRDAGQVNEMFPRDGKAIPLAGLGTHDECWENTPEKLLGFPDWMQTPIVPCGINLDRLKSLLAQQIRVRPTPSVAPRVPNGAHA